jgi:hypothetical protein
MNRRDDDELESVKGVFARLSCEKISTRLFRFCKLSRDMPLSCLEP